MDTGNFIPFSHEFYNVLEAAVRITAHVGCDLVSPGTLTGERPRVEMSFPLFPPGGGIRMSELSGQGLEVDARISHLHFSLARRPWATDLTFLCLSFFL